jgi:hypothetical protein
MSRAPLAKALSDEIRPSSAPAAPPTQIYSAMNKTTSRPRSIPPSLSVHARTKSESRSTNDPTKEPTGANPLDLMDLLQRSQSSVVKTRSGSVLSRGFILKTDHYPSGVYSFLILHS